MTLRRHRHRHRHPAAVLWDMDGTLVDTEPYWFGAERLVVERFGHGGWDHDLAMGMVGFDLLDGAAFLQRHGGVELPAEEIVEFLLDEVIARLRERIPWRPGARELLAELGRAGVPCALVTMSWRRFVDPVLAALPPGAFVATVVGDEIPAGHGKPHPTPYLLGAQACGAHPGDCVAIEDSPIGVRSAVAAGCRVLGVPNVRDIEPAPGVTVVESLVGIGLRELSAVPAATVDERVPAGRPSALVRAAALTALVAVTAGVTAAALLGGGDSTAELPPGAVPIDVWAPYWTLDDTVPQLGARLDRVREVSPFFFEATGATRIGPSAQADPELVEQFLDVARDAPGALVPSVVDAMPAGGMAAVLADPATRSRHVEALVAFAESLDADGLDIDYEQFAFADGRDTWASTRPNWVAFVAELDAALDRTGRTLTVSIPPVYDESVTGDPGYWVYDHGAIAEHLDALRIMAYDFSVPEPGPIAPLSWVGEVIAGVSLAVPEEHHRKLVLGVPAYGSNWVTSTVGTCPESAEGRTNVTTRSVGDLAARRNGVPVFDDVTGEWSFTYTLEVSDGGSSCTQDRRVHWVGAEGVAARATLAREAGWGGVSLWALGYEDETVWQQLVDAATAGAPSVTAAPR